MRIPLAIVGAAVLLGSTRTAPVAAQQTGSLPFGLIISEQARTSFTLRGAGARAAGMGDSFNAVADDATAASYNPAGLAQLLVPEGSVAVSARDLADDYSGFVSTDQVPELPLSDSRASSHDVQLNFGSITFPFRLAGRRWAVQVSTQQLVDLEYRGDRSFQETDAAGQPLFLLRQRSEQSGQVRLYSGSLAVKATERLHLGVTLNRWIGNWKFASFNGEAPAANPAALEWFDYEQTNALRGWNVDLGALLVYRYMNVGFRYRTPFDADYKFSATLDTNIPTSLQPSPETATTLRWPATWSMGLAVKPSDRFLIAVDWDRTDWRDMQFDVPGQGRVAFFDLAPRGTTHADRTDDLRIGAELLLFWGRTVIPLRAGWFREPEPCRDERTGERVVAQGVTVGAGVKSGWVGFDVAFRYRTGKAKVTRFLEPDEIARGELKATSYGTLKRSEMSVTAALIVQVPEGSAAARVFREVFVGPSRKN